MNETEGGGGSGTPAGWYPDPRQRHEVRYWDGTGWTDNVADRGVASVDPIDAPPTPAEHTSAAVTEAADAVADAAKRAWNALRGPSKETDLATLADLRQRGILSDAEYASAVARVNA